MFFLFFKNAEKRGQYERALSRYKNSTTCLTTLYLVLLSVNHVYVQYICIPTIVYSPGHKQMFNNQDIPQILTCIFRINKVIQERFGNGILDRHRVTKDLAASISA